MEKLLFADRLRNARETAEMSQEQMSSRIGVTMGTIASWEKGMSAPRANRLQMLASLLNVPLLWLIGGGQQTPKSAEKNTGAEDLRQKLGQVNSQMSALSSSLDELNQMVQSNRYILQ
jgi:transcriptional regulator with XRE-family HTH domain